jgi:hypothetical protein
MWHSSIAQTVCGSLMCRPLLSGNACTRRNSHDPNSDKTQKYKVHDKNTCKLYAMGLAMKGQSGHMTRERRHTWQGRGWPWTSCACSECGKKQARVRQRSNKANPCSLAPHKPAAATASTCCAVWWLGGVMRFGGWCGLVAGWGGGAVWCLLRGGAG